VSPPLRARPAGSLRGRARLLLYAGGSGFAALAALILLLRPEPEPYTPGTEAAGSDEITRRLERDLPPDLPAVRFADAAGEAGLRFRHFRGRRSIQLPEDMGSGAAWGDYDGDGDADLFLVNEEGPLAPDRGDAAAAPARSALFRNDGDGTFTDVTEAAGVGAGGLGMGAAWGDHDGDGDLDLVVTRFGTNLLYRNEGDETFTEVSARAGLSGPEGFWTGASWADFDRDGDLDLYVCGYVRYRFEEAAARTSTRQYDAVVPFTLNPSSYPPERNLLYRNDGGAFREVARQAGVDNPAGRSLSAAWGDLDADGWPDLYVANDVSDNALYRNLGNGRFEDLSHAAWVADYRGAMGLGIGDHDNDGDLDLFITHWIAQENALYQNLRQGPGGGAGPLRFLDVADQVGLGQIALDFIGWGTGFFDYDNDGRLDLFVANGSTFQSEDDPSRLIPMRNLLFWNGGSERGFFEVGRASGAPFALENVARGAAFADYDGDGDEDVAVVVNGGEARLLRNDGGSARGWLRVVLRGPAPPRRAAPGRRATTTHATGARVTLIAGGSTQVREVGAGPSYLSQSPPGEVRFGLGAAARADRLEILWPDGEAQTLTDLPARATVALVQGAEPSIEAAPAADATGSAGPGPATPATGATESAGPGAPTGRGTGEASRAEVVRFWEAYHRAAVLRAAGDLAGAAGAYEEALGLDPRHEDSLYHLGQCRLDLGLRAGAEEVLRRLIGVNPLSARGHQALGALLASPDESAPLDLAGAERHLRKAHDINGEETGPMVRLAEVLIVLGREEEARGWLEAALKTNARSVEAAFLLGYLRWSTGDRGGAASFYRRAVEVAAAESPTHGVLGEGDRRGAPGAQGGRTAAPPLRSPLGRTLLGAFSAPLRSGGATATDPAEAQQSYARLREFVRSLERRRSGSPGG
jgi:tetratricopeptide (TPR) repeat protein